MIPWIARGDGLLYLSHHTAAKAAPLLTRRGIFNRQYVNERSSNLFVQRHTNQFFVVAGQ